MIKIGEVKLFLGFLLISLAFAGIVSASFEVDNFLIKLATQSGEGASREINIYSESSENFDLRLLGLKGVSLSEDKFYLESGESKIVTIYFNSSEIEKGAYVGSLKISDGAKDVFVPIIFEVKSKDAFFDTTLDIPPTYSEVAPGDKIVAQIKIFDLTLGNLANWSGSHSLLTEFKVQDVFGNTIISESENVLVDGETQITKTLSLPKETKEGQYAFSVVVNYKSSIGVSSQTFSVKKASFFSDTGSGNVTLLIVVGAIVLFFLLMIGFFVYIVKDRDKFILDLKKYNSWEMERDKSLLSAQAKIVQKKKNVNAIALKKEVNQKIRELKARQMERVRELGRLKNKGNFKEMKKKVNEWKKKGYNTQGMEYKLKGLSTGEMKGLMSKWKKQYKGTEEYKKKKD